MPCSCKGGCLTNHCSCKKAGLSWCQSDCTCTNCHLGKSSTSPVIIVRQDGDDEIKRELSDMKRKMEGMRQSLQEGSRAVESLAKKAESLSAGTNPSFSQQELATTTSNNNNVWSQPSTTSLVQAAVPSNYSIASHPGHPNNPMVPWQHQQQQLQQPPQQTLTYSGEFSIHHLGPYAFFEILERQGLVLDMQNDPAGVRQYVYYFRGTNDAAMIVRVRGNPSMRFLVEVESRNAEIHNDFVAFLLREFPR